MTVSVELPKAVTDALESGKATLSPVQVGKILSISDATVRARAIAGMFDFPCLVSGKRVRIPTIPFLRWLGYDVQFKRSDDNVFGSGLQAER